MPAYCEKKLLIEKCFLVVFLVLLSLYDLDSFASGNYSSGKSIDHSKMDHRKKKKEETRKILSLSARESVLKVLVVNEELHNSFFKYEGNKIEIAAKKLESAIDNISDTTVSNLLKFSKTKLGEISASKSRDENNQNYHLVSMALIYIVNTYDVGVNYKAYFCPMVKMKWLQNSQKIVKVHNPYAPDMPYCGSQSTK